MEHDDHAVILDVRTSRELEIGIIPGAIHLDIYQAGKFMADIQALDREKSYYVYCKVGVRSGQACNIMQQLGFRYTYNLIGGMDNWNGEVTSYNNQI